MLSRLPLAHHRSLPTDLIQLVMLMIEGIGCNILQLLLYLRGLLALPLELVTELAALRRRELRRALRPDAALNLVARLAVRIVVHAHQIYVVLLGRNLPRVVYSACSSAVCQVVVHDEAPLPLLHAADCSRELTIVDTFKHEVILLIRRQFLPLALSC